MSDNKKMIAFEQERRIKELEKINEYKNKKISKSYPGYKPGEVDMFIDDILQNYATILNDYFTLKESYKLLEEQNQQLFNENQEEKQKVVSLSKQLELVKMQKK